MPYEREHRPDDRKIQDLLDKLAEPETEFTLPPGKTTHSELVGWLGSRALGWEASPTVVSGPGRVRHRAPTSGFHDFQALGLRDVLSQLNNKRALREATLAAADPEVAKRVMERGGPQVVDRSSASPHGEGLWRAAQRRAVTLYRRAFATGMVALETPAVANALASIGAGAPLDAAVCKKMERILGVRLDRVRLHTGAVARDAAHAVNADAFTVGEDVFLPSYDPFSASCQKLLLHELVHCCQWWQGRMPTGGHGIRVSHPSDALEHEAEAVVARAPIGWAARRQPREHLRHTPVDRNARGRDSLDSPGSAGARSSPFAPSAMGHVLPRQMPLAAPVFVMRRTASEEQTRTADLSGREWMAWIDTFLKGEYRWQVAIQDLFRSSLWASHEQVEEVAQEDARMLEQYASFIADNRGVVFASLTAFLAVGAGAVFATGAAQALCIALLAGFGLVGLVVVADEMLEHAGRYLQLVRQANGTPEGVAEASKEFIRLMMRLAIAVATAAGAMDLAKLPPSVARWLRGARLTEKEQEELVAARPFSGMSPSGDRKTGGQPGAKGDKADHDEAPFPQIAGGSDPVKRRGKEPRPVSSAETLLTTPVREQMTFPGGMKAWINASPIVQELLKELLRLGTWKVTDMNRYMTKRWGKVMGPMSWKFQLEQMRRALKFARSGPSNTDKVVEVGKISGTETIVFAPPKTGLVPVEIDRTTYWFPVTPQIHTALQTLAKNMNKFATPLEESVRKRVRAVLSQARDKDDLNAPTQVAGDLVVDPLSSEAYWLKKAPPEQKLPTGKKLFDLLK